MLRAICAPPLKGPAPGEHPGDRGLAGPYASALERPAPENGPVPPLVDDAGGAQVSRSGARERVPPRGGAGAPALRSHPGRAQAPNRDRELPPNDAAASQTPAEPTTSHTPTPAPATRRAEAPEPLEPSLSQAGFHGGLVSRIPSSGEETLRGHGTSEEIPG